MGTNLFLLLTIILIVLNGLAVFKKWEITKQITAPLSILGLLVWVALLSFSQTNSINAGSVIWLIIALLFSLPVPWFLNQYNHRVRFLIGFSLNIAAQIGYIIGFHPISLILSIPKIIVVILICIPIIQSGRLIVASLSSKKQWQIIPLAIFSLVICFVFTFSGLNTLTEGQAWADSDTFLVSSGVLLLFLNYIFVTLNAWVKPLGKMEFRTALTFLSGTFLLIVGNVLHLLK